MTTGKETDIPKVPFFGARKLAAQSLADLSNARLEIDSLREQLRKSRLEYLSARKQLQEYGATPIVEIEQKAADTQKALDVLQSDLERKTRESLIKSQELQAHLAAIAAEIEQAKRDLVVTEETAILQEVGVYQSRHRLEDAASYAGALKALQERIKEFNKNRESAISATTNWTVNSSLSQGKKMVSDFSKLMLLAFNAEVDALVGDLKPYKLDRAIERIRKISETISRLGKTMSIRITDDYLMLRIKELELTADFIDKQAREKEAAREEQARLREERKAQAELERERQRLEKEKQHYQNALNALRAKGDEEGALRIAHQLEDVDKAIQDVDYRAANIRAGYVYVISNIGSFGESMVKIGMTRRLEPMDRINELGDASVPFRFDVHALFFSKDAVTIETEMHKRLAEKRVNRINTRREFFNCSPTEAKAHLSELAGELLEFTDAPEALEWRQSAQHNSQPGAAREEIFAPSK